MTCEGVARTYTQTHTHTHKRIHTLKHKHMRKVHIRAHEYMDSLKCTFTHTHMYTDMYENTRTGFNDMCSGTIIAIVSS